MKILITGASSYVGSRIYSDLKKKFTVVGTYHSHKLFPELKLLDITDKENVRNFTLTNKPAIIIHVAANASGSWCEKNPKLAVEINEKGTKNIVDAANAAKSKVIFISSFAIYDTKSLYGKTKASGEEYVKNVKAGYIILRPSLIIGLSPNTTNDRPFNRILKNITEHTPAIYDTSWKFQPTWLKHIVEAIEDIIQRKIINETIPIAVPEVKTRFDVAKDLLSYFDLQVIPEDNHDTQPVFTDRLSELRQLKLPRYTYDEMIAGIRKEIKGYLKTNRV